MGQTETEDRVKGIPFAAAARAACTSPRRAYMPVSPTGARTIGRSSLCSKSLIERSTAPTCLRIL